MTPTNEDLLALADRLDGVEIYSVRANRSILGTRPIDAANNAVCEAAAALRALVAERLDVSEPPAHDHQRDLVTAAERQAIRDQALEDAAQGVSNRAAYWWDEAMAASDARRWKLSIVYEAKALACTETAAAIRAMKGRPE